MKMLWTLLVTKKTSEYYHEKPMENYQSRITAQKDPSEKWLVSWGGFVDFLFQPLPLILQLHTLENEHIFWSQNWDLDGRCCCGLFFFNLGVIFFGFICRFILKELFFRTEKFCPKISVELARWWTHRLTPCIVAVSTYVFDLPHPWTVWWQVFRGWLVVGERMIHEGI